MKIYLASSWKNEEQQRVLAVLRGAGHDVYDFRNPSPGDTGFQWRQVGLQRPASVADFRAALLHDRAVEAFNADAGALAQADCCVLLNPSGRSAHLEAGWAAGSGRGLIVYTHDGQEPELMYRWAAHIVSTDPELLAAVADVARQFRGRR